jgi:AcrR family transcriptional regulator
VIHAAIECILKQGFYRASSNAIAETAGLSWGVIQYYFGSRESLMLAVLEEGNRRLTGQLSEADITAESMAGRLEEYFTILEGYYADPDYLAFIQVLLNLSHDPTTSDQTRESMVRAAEEIDAQINRLTDQLFAGTNVRRPALRTFPFNVLRGLALSEVMLTTLPFDTRAMRRGVSGQRQLLARAVALLLEGEVETP